MSASQSPGEPSPLVRFLLKHLIAGAIAGAVFVAMILYFDFGGIGGMIRASSEPVLWVFMLYFGVFITFGSIAMGVGVMGMGEERDE